MSGMEAICTNCDKQWDLTKHPTEYARGVTCPNCGSTSVDIPEYDEQQAQSQQSPSPQQQPTQQQTAQRQPTQQQSQPAQAPARREQPNQNAPRAQHNDRGLSGPETAIALLDGDVDPERRAQAAEQTAGFVGRLFSKAIRYNEQKNQARDQRAQRAQFEENDVYHECECGYHFTGEDIGLNDDVAKCSECGRTYDVIDPE
jgi:DNA-directed RNA polymerase subunit RPC12/RpoP